MALNSMGLGFVFTARDLASGAMARLERRFQRLDDRVTGGSGRMDAAFRRLGAGMAVFSAGAVALGSGFALASAAGTFEQRLAGVGAITQATTGELEALRAAAVDAGIRTQFSPEESVQGLEELATAGQTAGQSIQTLIPVLDLAAGSLGQLGVAESAAAVVGTLNAYQLSADQAANVTDRLLRITQLTNLQTRDFEAGLSKAAATGAMFGQSMDDVLITLGMLRNRNIDPSSAGTAVREAIRRVGSMSHAQAALGPDVDVFDQDTGRMRSIIDIMQDFGRASAEMTEEDRNRRLNIAFGARGMLAFQAIMSASFTTMRDGREVTLKGVEATRALREAIEESGGVAESFRRRLQDTFAGQARLLVGVLQTLAVVAGEPFAAVLKPVLAAGVSIVTSLVSAIQAVPAPMRRAFAVFVMAGGALLTAVGGAIALEATIALLIGSAKLIAAAIGGLVAIMLPAIAATALLGAVVAGFVIAVRRNVGGLGDLFTRVGQRIQLVFGGLSQLFEQGGFSGAVREELNRAENQGVRRFLVTLFMLAYRAQRMWQGFTEGFAAAIEEAAPVFDDMRGALASLWEELSHLFGSATDQASSLPSSQYVSWGARIGRAVATVVRWFARFVAIGARVASGVLPGIRAMAAVLRPSFAAIGIAVRSLMSALGGLTGASEESGRGAGASTEGWRTLGEVIGRLISAFVSFNLVLLSVAIDGITFVVRAVGAVRSGLASVARWTLAAGRAVRDFFTVTIPNAASAALARVLGVLERMRAAAAPVLRFFGVQVGDQPLSEVVGLGQATPNTAEAGSARAARTSSEALAPSTTSAMPALAGVARRGAEATGLSAQLASLVNVLSRREDVPLQVQVQVDGEAIAEATHRANRDVAARSFSPVPSFG